MGTKKKGGQHGLSSLSVVILGNLGQGRPVRTRLRPTGSRSRTQQWFSSQATMSDLAPWISPRHDFSPFIRPVFTDSGRINCHFSLWTLSLSSFPRVLRNPTVSLAVRDASIVAGSFARPSAARPGREDGQVLGSSVE